MPIEVIMTEGLVSKEDAQKMHKEIAKTFLAKHNLTGNTFMTQNVIGEVTFAERGLTFSNLEPCDIAIVELRAPAFALESKEQKEQFVSEVTQIVLRATAGKLPIEQIWVNMVYAVDGLWGIGGKAYTNADLGAAIGAAAEQQVA